MAVKNKKIMLDENRIELLPIDRLKLRFLLCIDSFEYHLHRKRDENYVRISLRCNYINKFTLEKLKQQFNYKKFYFVNKRIMREHALKHFSGWQLNTILKESI